jgi:hypothetical protein
MLFDGGRQASGAGISPSQPNALLPASAGKFREHSDTSFLAEDYAALPECLTPPTVVAHDGTLKTPTPELYNYINYPVTSAAYTSGEFNFNVELFGLRRTEIARVRNLIKAAPGSCRQAMQAPGSSGTQVSKRIRLTIGNATAAYQSYVGRAMQTTSGLVPASIELIADSAYWGLTISADAPDVDAMIQSLPSLLRQLDATLSTSFWTPAGSFSELYFQTPPYVAEDGLGSTPVYKPSQLSLDGSGSFILAQLHWLSWSQGEARAKGFAVVNLCDPDCSSGPWDRTPVDAVFSAAQYKCGVFFFGRLRLHFQGDIPRGYSQDESMPAISVC